MSKIVHPAIFQIIRREGDAWYFRLGKVFYREPGIYLSAEEREREYGLSKEKIVIELFRINGGKAGYYLANLRDRKYYYCGTNWEDIKVTFQSLGIGRADPLEK